MNLSDIFEYMNEEDTEDLFALLSSRMATGGRVAVWNYLVDRCPHRDSSSFEYLHDLSEKLHKEDRVFWYRSFLVLQVM